MVQSHIIGFEGGLQRSGLVQHIGIGFFRRQRHWPTTKTQQIR